MVRTLFWEKPSAEIHIFLRAVSCGADNVNPDNMGSLWILVGISGDKHAPVAVATSVAITWGPDSGRV